MVPHKGKTFSSPVIRQSVVQGCEGTVCLKKSREAGTRSTLLSEVDITMYYPSIHIFVPLRTDILRGWSCKASTPPCLPVFDIKPQRKRGQSPNRARNSRRKRDLLSQVLEFLYLGCTLDWVRRSKEKKDIKRYLKCPFLCANWSRSFRSI